MGRVNLKKINKQRGRLIVLNHIAHARDQNVFLLVMVFFSFYVRRVVVGIELKRPPRGHRVRYATVLENTTFLIKRFGVTRLKYIFNKKQKKKKKTKRDDERCDEKKRKNFRYERFLEDGKNCPMCGTGKR